MYLMFELDGGAQSIAATAISTSQSQDKTHTLLGELRKVRKLAASSRKALEGIQSMKDLQQLNQP